MSDWLDPLAMRALLRHIRAEQRRLREIADRKDRRSPGSRTAAKCRARREELSSIMRLLEKLRRPGAELRPYRTLVQADGSRREVIEALVPRDAMDIAA